MDELIAELAEQRVEPARGRGSPRLIRAERRQVSLRPVSLDEVIGPDHLARLVWNVVERFDLTLLLDAVEAREGKPGHPQTDPQILVALWLYATLDGVGSARELARLCEQHHAYQWLCGGVSLNHHTLSNFRVAHADWLDAELTRGVASLLAAGEVDLACVAQDGLRVRASAGSGSFRRKPRLEQFLEAAQAHVEALKADLPGEGSPRTRRQAAADRAARERLARVQAALDAVPEVQARKKRNKGDPSQARVSTTDVEARKMKMPDGGFRPAFNVQFAAETKQGLVAAVRVSNAGGDASELDGMHAKVCDAYGRAPANWLADGGFISQAGIEAVTGRDSAVYLPLSSMLATCNSPAVKAWRERMASEAGRMLYRLRPQTIEWVNAGARQRGFYSVNVRGMAKVRAVALWQGLAHNVARVLSKPALRGQAWKAA